VPFPRRLIKAALTPAAAATLALVAAACGGSGGATAKSTTTSSAAGRGAAAPTLQATLASYRLTAPLSREVVLADGTSLVILGGLDRAQQSAAGVYRLDPATGQLSHLGALPSPVHDAAGAEVGGRWLVLGGGAPTTFDKVQSFSPSAGGGQLVGHLPRPRSDLAAATIGGTAYVAGGYDGSRPTPEILATTDGSSFRQVGTLTDGVRYPAVAASGGKLYLFGGESGSSVTADIQAFDPGSGQVRVVGQLPAPLSHASAVTLGGQIWVLGGKVGNAASDQILRFDPSTGKVSAAGQLPEAVTDAGATVVGDTGYLVGGEAPQTLDTVVTLTVTTGPSALGGAPDPAPAAASVPGSSTWKPGQAPFKGQLLIADRGNDRLIVVDANKQLLWQYPSATAPAPPGGFYFPDDGFFVRHGTSIISNEEGNNTIVQISYPAGQVIWTYGHPHSPGSAAGYLNQPDDAYLLADGTVSVADAMNCRILFIDGQGSPVSQIGTTGRCVHAPPTELGYPNGDTPLPDGNFLISEIHGSWISEYTPAGGLVWTVQLPIAYPSDPQQLGPDLYIVADYSRPGGIYEFNREGQILWSYKPTSGEDMLDHPSLAERLPNGLIGTNDDYRHRVVLIDPTTGQIAWQYGQTDVAGTGADQLHTPDGFDLLAPDHTTPTHPQTG